MRCSYRLRLRILLCCILALTGYFLFIVASEFKVIDPDIQFEKYVGRAVNRLANPADALGDNDLRVAFTTQNTDVLEWKLKLIREAEHSILFADVLGGRVLQKAMEIVEVKLRTIPHFQAVILRYAREDVYCTGNPLPLAEQLNVTYPDRFQYFFIPLTDGIYNSYKVHIKTVMADYGKYFTLGSSVFMDFMPYHDLDSEFIFEDWAGIVGPKLWDGIVDASAAFVHNFSDKYRTNQVDMDRLLRIVDVHTNKTCAHARLNACGFPNRGNNFRSMSIPIPKPEIYFSGPGQRQNELFVNDMVEAINAAKHRIVITHCYFAVPDRIKVALVNAARRGLRIIIVTQGLVTEKTTLKGLAMRGVSAANDVEQATILSSGLHVKAYTFIGGKNSLVKSYHKKVVVVDDVVFGGSANMGPKSMVDFIDLEVSFKVVSRALADEYEIVAGKDAQNHCAGVYGVSWWSFALAHLWHFVRGFLSFANY